MNGDKKYFDELIKNNTLEVIANDLDKINKQVIKGLKNVVAYHTILYDLNDYLIDQYINELDDKRKDDMRIEILTVY